MKSVCLRGASMKSLLGLIATALIASGVSLCAQDVAQNATSPSSPALAVCDPDKFEPPLEVLSDATGVDLHQYLFGVTRKINFNWRGSMRADEGSSPSSKSCATINFSIQKDGKLAEAKLVQSSGNETLERAAKAGIAASAPFPALPEEFAGNSLALRFHFYYNPQQGPLIPFRPQDGLQRPAPALVNASPGGVPIEGKTYQGKPVYKPGGGVTLPEGVDMPDPEYTDRARKKKLTGVVVLEVIVTPEGNVGDVKVVRLLEPGLDQKAVDAVRRWKFRPGTREGQPVAVQINVEISFNLMK